MDFAGTFALGLAFACGFARAGTFAFAAALVFAGRTWPEGLRDVAAEREAVAVPAEGRRGRAAAEERDAAAVGFIDGRLAGIALCFATGLRVVALEDRAGAARPDGLCLAATVGFGEREALEVRPTSFLAPPAAFAGAALGLDVAPAARLAAGLVGACGVPAVRPDRDVAFTVRVDDALGRAGGGEPRSGPRAAVRVVDVRWGRNGDAAWRWWPRSGEPASASAEPAAEWCTLSAAGGAGRATEVSSEATEGAAAGALARRGGAEERGSSRGAGGRGTPRRTATGCAAADGLLRRGGTGAGATGVPSEAPGPDGSALSRQANATTSLISGDTSNLTIAVWLSTVSTRPSVPTS